MEARQQQKKPYTYADYIQWSDESRYELIDGEAYMLAAPLPEHQSVSTQLTYLLVGQLIGKPCRVFAAPIDVRFENSSRAKNVVQPDLLVVCDRKKIGRKGLVGAPTLAIEILSPSSVLHDMNRKKELYERMKVPEYWVINSEARAIYQFKLDGERYDEGTDIAKGRIDSSAVEGLGFELDALFSALDIYEQE